jgi:hypothetical protein
METARDLILKLYKENHITKEETDILLDAINAIGTTTTFLPYVDWPYMPYQQPKWTITSNTDNTNVE